MSASVPLEQRNWLLKPLQIEGLPSQVVIPADGITIGRASTCDIEIPEAGFPYVSSSHARLRLVDGEPTLEDLGSKNGTLLNGVRIDRSRVTNGDIVQLGNMGPRFAVVCADVNTETLPTVALPPSNATRHSDLSQTSLMRIKRALGIPSDVDVSTMVQRRSTRLMRHAGVAMLAVIVVTAATFWFFERRTDAEANRVRELSAELEAARGILVAQEETLRRQEEAWQGERARLQNEGKTLAARLAKLESDAGTSAGTLALLRTQIDETKGKLQLYDNVKLEADRLAGVRRVTRAVVFIGASVYFRHPDLDKRVYVRDDGYPFGINFEDEGEPFVLESSGTGFCVTPDGWIITNAHVVEPRTADNPLSDQGLVPEVVLDVVFNETETKYPARKIKSVYGEGLDVALLKIEPFEGMPYVESIDLDQPVPEPMTEVYLSGFPLGKMAIQHGRKLTASTFRGILSRIVPPFFQVDAAVHPGNSGGPVMDNQGHVLGIATRVQRTPDGPYAPTIGYILPIAAAKHVWPPPTDPIAIDTPK